jgi:transposase
MESREPPALAEKKLFDLQTSSSLAKKSVLDAGWSSFRHMLRYKSARRQAVYVDVDERLSSQVCSACGSLPPSRLRGIADLGIREWECSECGTSHNRDVNAARNILATALEHQRLVGGITAL